MNTAEEILKRLLDINGTASVDFDHGHIYTDYGDMKISEDEYHYLNDLVKGAGE